MDKLRIDDFNRIQGSFPAQHYFEHKFEDGGTICLESCMGGYCVARYDSKQEIISDKICTRMVSLELSPFADLVELDSEKAITKALEIANTLI